MMRANTVTMLKVAFICLGSSFAIFVLAYLSSRESI